MCSVCIICIARKIRKEDLHSNRFTDGENYLLRRQVFSETSGLWRDRIKRDPILSCTGRHYKPTHTTMQAALPVLRRLRAPTTRRQGTLPLSLEARSSRVYSKSELWECNTIIRDTSCSQTQQKSNMDIRYDGLSIWQLPGKLNKRVVAVCHASTNLP